MEKCFNDILKDIYDLYNTGNTEEAKALLDKETREFCNDENSKDLFWNNQAADLMKSITLFLFEENISTRTVNLETIKNVVDDLLTCDGGSNPETKDKFFDLPTRTAICSTKVLASFLEGKIKDKLIKTSN